MEKVLHLSPAVVFRQETFGGVLYDRMAFTYVLLNPLGYYVIDWINAEGDVPSLLADLSREFPGIHSQVIRNDVFAFVQELYKEGFSRRRSC